MRIRGQERNGNINEDRARLDDEASIDTKHKQRESARSRDDGFIIRSLCFPRSFNDLHTLYILHTIIYSLGEQRKRLYSNTSAAVQI